MNNQERNRDALIEHIAEQDRIIRRRNEQIANQAQNAREDQKAIEEQEARNNSLAADLADAVVRAEKAERRACPDLDAHWRLDEAMDRAEKAEQERDEWKESAIKAMADLERTDQPRPLAADDITDEMVKRAQREEERQCGDWAAPTAMRHILAAALTEPTRPEEKVEAVLHQYWSGDIDGDDLAALIVEEMNR